MMKQNLGCDDDDDDVLGDPWRRHHLHVALSIGILNDLLDFFGPCSTVLAAEARPVRIHIAPVGETLILIFTLSTALVLHLLCY